LVHHLLPTAVRRIILSLTLLCVSCQPLCCPLQCQLEYERPARDIAQTESAFPAYSASSDWGREAVIGNAFAKQNDLYRAITAWKRALILLPDSEHDRRLQLLYNITLANASARRWTETVDLLETSPLGNATEQFPAYGDLTSILYQGYIATDATTKASRLLAHIRASDPNRADRLELWHALSTADLCEAYRLADEQGNRRVLYDLALYEANAKSPTTAAFLNGILPGAGYLYTGQVNTALTSFLLNGLFLWAAIEFFRHGLIAPGIITTSVEVGWYFGGMYGAGLAAKCYNQNLYQQLVTPTLTEQRLFPILQLRYGF
jgi:hypothetical protein